VVAGSVDRWGSQNVPAEDEARPALVVWRGAPLMNTNPRMDRRGKLWGVFALVLLATRSLLYAQQVPPVIPRPDFSQQQACQVVRVVDGHTVVVLTDEKETTLRLVGVTTPAIGRPYHDEAKRFAENLLVGESVYLQYDPPASPGEPERPAHAYLFRAPDGLFVNLEIVRQGYGKLLTNPPFEHQKLFRFHEQKARQARKGVWQPPERRRPSATAPAAHRSPASRPSAEASDVIVYVTRTGRKYHRKGCAHLRKSAIPMRLSEAKRRGYTPCSHCKPPE
jgi:micrococcal nuclease